MWFGFFSEFEVVIRMAAAEHVRLAAGTKFGDRIFADHCQHSETTLAVQ